MYSIMRGGGNMVKMRPSPMAFGVMARSAPGVPASGAFGKRVATGTVRRSLSSRLHTHDRHAVFAASQSQLHAASVPALSRACRNLVSSIAMA
jgi:hypothetical protein